MNEISISDEKIIIDFSLAKNNKSSQNYSLKLTSEEESILPSLDHFEYINGSYSLSGGDNYYNGICKVEGKCYLKDSRDLGHLIEYPFSNDVDFNIIIGDDENSDIFPESDGSYNIRPVFLALIYDALPSFYTETDLSSLNDEDTKYYSEEDFKKKR